MTLLHPPVTAVDGHGPLSCGVCGHTLGAAEALWIFGRERTRTCEGCTPDALKLRSRQLPCRHCGRLIGAPARHRRRPSFCDSRCQSSFYNAVRQARTAPSREKVCSTCRSTFTATRADAITCSARCRQAAHRERQRTRTEQPTERTTEGHPRRAAGPLWIDGAERVNGPDRRRRFTEPCWRPQHAAIAMGYGAAVASMSLTQVVEFGSNSVPVIGLSEPAWGPL